MISHAQAALLLLLASSVVGFASCSGSDGGAPTPRDALAGFVQALQPRPQENPADRALRARSFFPPSLPAEVENRLRIALALSMTLQKYEVQLVDIRMHGDRATALVREASIFQHSNARFPPQDELRREREYFLVQIDGRWYIAPPDIGPIRRRR
ncbi:MAG: hypothetical protein HYY84_15050 [Deltaproteobacteria bacterium]|nr:hypothetical protein [Deltaproteobacteria bacterium]